MTLTRGIHSVTTREVRSSRCGVAIQVIDGDGGEHQQQAWVWTTTHISHYNDKYPMLLCTQHESQSVYQLVVDSVSSRRPAHRPRTHICRSTSLFDERRTTANQITSWCHDIHRRRSWDSLKTFYYKMIITVLTIHTKWTKHRRKHHDTSHFRSLRGSALRHVYVIVTKSSCSSSTLAVREQQTQEGRRMRSSSLKHVELTRSTDQLQQPARH